MAGDRRVSGLRVGDVPVARGDLREERQECVPEVPVVRDQVPRLTREQPVCLRVVDLVVEPLA